MTQAIASVPFYKHGLGNAEIEAVTKALQSPILTTGDTVAAFEKQFADYLSTKYAFGVTSCTGALHMSLLSLGIGPGHEVITTPMTFIATATSIIEAGAKPVFVDIEPDTGNIDATVIENAVNKNTRAILPIHLFGQMCDMVSISKIAKKHGLKIVEDAAHCVEGTRDDIRPGELSDTACFSFYATKNLTCGEGGAVTTNDDILAEKLKLLRCHGMTKTAADRAIEGYSHWDMTTLGWKYNMDNIQASMLIPQLNRIGETHARRRLLSDHYQNRLSDLTGQIQVPAWRNNTRHALHLFTILVAPEKRDAIIDGLKAKQIGVMVNYRAIHLLTYFRETFGFRAGAFPNAEHFGDSVLSLPFYPSMTIEDIDYVVDTLKRLV